MVTLAQTAVALPVVIFSLPVGSLQRQLSPSAPLLDAGSRDLESVERFREAHVRPNPSHRCGPLIIMVTCQIAAENEVELLHVMRLVERYAPGDREEMPRPDEGAISSAREILSQHRLQCRPFRVSILYVVYYSI